MAIGIGKFLSTISSPEFQQVIANLMTEAEGIKADRAGLKAALPKAFAHFDARLARQEKLLIALCTRLDVDAALADCDAPRTAAILPEGNPHD